MMTSLLQVTLDFRTAAQGQGLPGSLTTFGGFLSSVIQFIMVISVLMVLLYLLWGAMEWIWSGGDKGKIQKGRDKMTNAVIGIIVLSAVIAIFVMLQKFLGLNILSFPGMGGGSGSGTGNGGGSGSCNPADPVWKNDGGAGHYCTNGGAAWVQCHAPDTHPNGSYSYNHYDPCRCISGEQVPGYEFRCTGNAPQ